MPALCVLFELRIKLKKSLFFVFCFLFFCFFCFFFGFLLFYYTFILFFHALSRFFFFTFRSPGFDAGYFVATSVLLRNFRFFEILPHELFFEKHFF